MKIYVKFLSQIAQETRGKNPQILLFLYVVLVLVFVPLMSQASYNLVTSVPMLIP